MKKQILYTGALLGTLFATQAALGFTITVQNNAPQPIVVWANLKGAPANWKKNPHLIPHANIDANGGIGVIDTGNHCTIGAYANIYGKKTEPSGGPFYFNNNNDNRDLLVSTHAAAKNDGCRDQVFVFNADHSISAVDKLPAAPAKQEVSILPVKPELTVVDEVSIMPVNQKSTVSKEESKRLVAAALASYQPGAYKTKIKALIEQINNAPTPKEEKALFAEIENLAEQFREQTLSLDLDNPQLTAMAAELSEIDALEYEAYASLAADLWR